MSLNVAEEWRPVKGYEEYYRVSNLGRVKSITRIVRGKNGKPRNSPGKILRPKIDKKGYACVVLCVNNIRKCIQVHILVAFAFLEECPGKHGHKKGEYQIDHIDNNSLNNNASNLQWLSTKDHHAKTACPIKGTAKHGEQSALSKLTKEQVVQIRNDYRPLSDIAKEYNVSHFAIDAIISNKTWKHLSYPNYEKQVAYRKIHKYKLTEADVINIYQDPRSVNKIAEEYSVTPGTIYHIKRKHTWSHVTSNL